MERDQGIPERPRLRPVEAHALDEDGDILLVRDGSGLGGNGILVTRAGLGLLALLDGTRDLGDIQTEWFRSTGELLSREDLERMVAALDEELLLHSPRFEEVLSRRTRSYRAGGLRRAAHASVSYPEDPEALAALLDGYLAGTDSRSEDLLGLFVPHIDFARGGRTYARGYALLEGQPAPGLVVVLGVDHSGPLPEEPLVATGLDFETPLGRLDVDREALEWVEQAVGTGLRRAELAHEAEHSVEFQLVWLQHVFRGQDFKILPLLCSTMALLVEEGRRPSEHETLTAVLSALRRLFEARNWDVLLVAGGDLAHVGPAFGGAPVGQAELGTLEQGDRAWLELLADCRPEALYEQCLREAGSRNVCGLGAGYVLASLLADRGQGRVLDYAVCPADDSGTSWVSIGAVAFSRTPGGKS